MANSGKELLLSQQRQKIEPIYTGSINQAQKASGHDKEPLLLKLGTTTKNHYKTHTPFTVSLILGCSLPHFYQVLHEGEVRKLHTCNPSTRKAQTGP